MQVDGVDNEEVGLYLVINTKTEVLQRSGLAEVCLTRKYKCGRKPAITASGTAEKNEK